MSVKTILKLGKCIRHYKLLYELRLPAMKQWTMATTVLYHSSPLFQPEQFVAQRSKNCRQIMLTTKPVCFRLFFLQFCSKTCFVLLTNVLCPLQSYWNITIKISRSWSEKSLNEDALLCILDFFFLERKTWISYWNPQKKNLQLIKKKTKTFFNENNNSHVPQAI